MPLCDPQRCLLAGFLSTELKTLVKFSLFINKLAYREALYGNRKFVLRLHKQFIVWDPATAKALKGEEKF